MIDGEGFVTELADRLKPPQVIVAGGEDVLVTPPGWNSQKCPRPAVEPLKVGTLTGLLDYVRDRMSDDGRAASLIHVVDPGTVAVRGGLEDEATGFRRQTYLVALTSLIGSPPFPFGQYVDAEMFFIGLQAGFFATPARDEVLGLLASIRESQVRETTDSGVAQEVRASKGITLVTSLRVPNPVVLRPYRTFREVDQPASSFILRLQSAPDGQKPRCGLFEADGGQWKLQAIEAVALYLRDHVASLAIKVVA